MQRLTHNWNLKLVSVVLAVMLWSHVRGEVNPLETATVDVPLRVRAPLGFVVANRESLPRRVSVTLRGPRLALRDITSGGPANPLAPGAPSPGVVATAVRATLDFSGPRDGEQTVAVRAESRVADVEALGPKPEVVTVVLRRAPHPAR